MPWRYLDIWEETQREDIKKIINHPAAGLRGQKGKTMNTAKYWAGIFTARTTGRKAIFQVDALTLNALKVVLNGIQLNLNNVEGATEDLKRGFLRREINSGFYSGADGYIPTAKGFRKILAELS
jgi:hypothetical protein